MVRRIEPLATRALHTVTLIAVFSLLAACNNNLLESDSSPSVVPVTPPRSQGQIGFCWAYAAVAMVESSYKKRTGMNIDLSEEALGFFHFAEQLKAGMDRNLSSGNSDYKLEEGNWFIFNNRVGSKGAFELIKRWGLIPESEWSVKFENALNTKTSLDSIRKEFLNLQSRLRGQQVAVQFNQIFKILTENAFPSVPPVDGFDNGSGHMDAVQYANNVIRFDTSVFEDIWIDKGNKYELFSSLMRVKKALVEEDPVGFAISMPSSKDWKERIQGNRFLGFQRAFKIDGAHAMVITDFNDADKGFDQPLESSNEFSKEIGLGFRLRLKNSWGSETGVNEFGQVIDTGFYDMDLSYMLDVLDSEGGFVQFTFHQR
jgi:hypothetical protein